MVEQAHFFIGNQTAFCSPLSDPFGFAVEHHFDAFEFFPDDGPNGRGWGADDVAAAQRIGFRTVAEERNIRLSVHAALAAKLLEPDTWASLMHDIDLAKDLRAKVLNVHLASGDIMRCARAALSLTDVLQPLGIVLALENTVSTGVDEVNEIFRLILQAESARPGSVGLCLDIGHANLQAATHNDYLRFVDGLASYVPIVHAHLHENWGDRDSHLTLFTGPAGQDSSGIAGLVRRLRQRGFNGSLILEQWPVPSSLLLTARERLRAM